MIKKRIEEGLDNLIEIYTIEIEDDTKCLKKYKDKLENVLKESDCLSEVDNSRICSLHKIVLERQTMIRLKNLYSIVSDGKSYTLVQDAIQTSKNGEEKEIQKSISFHSTLEGALQGYSNCRMADLVANVDLDLKQVKEAINELKEELKAYE